MRRLKQIRLEVDKTADALGKPIDNGIKETVVFLNALGITTTGSCEGHMKNGLPWPWVDIEDPDQPEEQFEDQNKIFEEFAKKNGLKAEKLKRGEPLDVWLSAHKTARKNPETAAYRDWTKKNEEIVRKVKDLLKEYYNTKEVEDSKRLTVNGTRLESKRETDDDPDISSEIREDYNKALPQKQAEMAAFTKFLEGKYQQERDE